MLRLCMHADDKKAVEAASILVGLVCVSGHFSALHMACVTDRQCCCLHRARVDLLLTHMCERFSC